MIERNYKRLCIYFIYDKNGIIDDYIVYQLKELRKDVDFIFCVVNGELTDISESKIKGIVDCVYKRENVGNDIGAYKAAIEKLRWENIREYDELVIMNFTCFGPIYPFREVFEWSENQDVDFWGLTLDEKSDWLESKKYLHYNKSRIHYQSNFLVLRRRLLESKLIEDFFYDIPKDSKYIESGCFYEYAFPGFFEEHGYKGAVYCNEKDDLNYPLLYNPVKLMRKYRMPLVKKRSFFHHYTDFLNNSGGEPTANLIDFIKDNTNYDMGLIWQSILRTCSLSDVVRVAQLNRVITSKFLVSDKSFNSKVGIIFHTYYENLFEEDSDYLVNLPENIDLLITTDTVSKKETIENILSSKDINGSVKVVTNRGRDVSALLVGCYDFVMNHDLICFVHDKKTPQLKPYSAGRSWAYKLKENTIGNRLFIQNVVSLFENEPNLGIAFPSYPNHNVFSTVVGTGWTGNFDSTKNLLDKFGVKVKINERTLCVAPLGTCFWFRTDALKKVFNGVGGQKWSYDDFPAEPNKVDNTILHAIERSLAYFAQDAGFYPVYLYNDKYTEIELTNLEFNKTGSTEMRAWVDKLAMDAIGVDSTCQTNEEVLNRYEGKINYGIRQSLLHLAFAVRCKYPTFWSILLPIRRIGQKLLKIKTK
ncbi:MAG: rhamnan synthesis F family protein [Phascolarctobacterium sp.]|nr:rhamnan synthesis F family protein [Phascolarctobacterium sp.]